LIAHRYNKQIAGFFGIDQLPIEPFTTFWDDDYFIENLKDLIKVFTNHDDDLTNNNNTNYR